MLKTIKLTQQDVNELSFALGYAQGASSKEEGQPSFTRITDRILVQLGAINYTYGKNRGEVLEELKADGIEVSE